MQTPERCGSANGVNDTGPNWNVQLRGSANVFALFLLDLVVQYVRALTLKLTDIRTSSSEILCLLTKILLQASVPLKVNSKFNFISNKSTVYYKSDLQKVATIQIQVAMVTFLEHKNQPYCNYVPWVLSHKRSRIGHLIAQLSLKPGHLGWLKTNETILQWLFTWTDSAGGIVKITASYLEEKAHWMPWNKNHTRHQRQRGGDRDSPEER